MIRPTDEEIGKYICITAARNGLKSVASDKPATITEPAGVNSLLRGRGGSRQIEDDAGRLGMRRQNLGHQRAVAATNIDYGAELAEIIGLDLDDAGMVLH